MFEKLFRRKDTIPAKEEIAATTTTVKNDTYYPEIAICDEAVLIYSLNVLKEKEHIYIPKTCYNIIAKIASGKFVDFMRDDYSEQVSDKLKAIEALNYIKENEGWCTIIPNLDKTDSFVYIEDFKPKFKTRVIISLACLYYESGYDVCIYTRTKEVRDCASLQPNIKVKYIINYDIED